MVKRTKKKRLPKYIQKKVEKVNKIFKSWKQAGVTSNDLELAQGLFKKFYKDEKKKNVVQKEMASKNILVDKAQKEEYNKILDYVLSDEFIDLSERQQMNERIKEKLKTDDKAKQTFNTLKNKYEYVNDEQSYYDFIDNMNRYKNDRLLSSILSSDQIANLYGYGVNKGYKENEIDDMLVKSYKATGLIGSSMYNDILKQMKVIRGKSVYQKTMEKVGVK